MRPSRRPTRARSDAPARLRHRLRALFGLTEDAVERGLVGPETPRQQALARLAERNVVDQVTTLTDHLGDGVTVAGYVHDETGVYGATPDRHYLVAVDDRTDPGAVAARVPDDRRPAVSTLL